MLESPQQAIVENKFLVMRELVQHWVAHGEFSLLKSRRWKLSRLILPLVWIVARKRDTAKEIREKGKKKEKEKEQGQEPKWKREGRLVD